MEGLTCKCRNCIVIVNGNLLGYNHMKEGSDPCGKAPAYMWRNGAKDWPICYDCCVFWCTKDDRESPKDEHSGGNMMKHAPEEFCMDEPF